MKQTPANKFIRNVTSGLWIIPWKRREARRELAEHIDDIAIEKEIDIWTPALLHKYIGSEKNLQKKYSTEGIPMWAKFFKFGLHCFFFLLFCLIALDLYILWLYKPDAVSQMYIQDKNPYLGMAMGVDLPKLEIRWIEPGDDSSQKTYNKLTTVMNTWANYKKRSEPEPIGLPPKAGDTAPPLQKPDPNSKPPELSAEEYKTIWDQWTSISPDEKLAFPRSQVTDQDIEKLQNLLQSANSSTPHEPWLGVAGSLKPMYEDMPDSNIIQYAKDIYVFDSAILKIQNFCDEFAGMVPEKDKQQFLHCNTLWLKQYFESFSPTPEPWIALLAGIAAINVTQKQFQNCITNLDHIERYKDDITIFSSIDLKNNSNYYTYLTELVKKTNQWTWMDSLSVAFGELSVCRWQCSLMQKFCKTDSPSFRRYHVIQGGTSRFMLNSIQLSNLSSTYCRLKTAQAGQALSSALPKIYQNYSEKKNLADSISIPDPFTQENIRIDQAEKSIKIRSTGPDKTFDTETYSPSNGLTSKGDIVWEITRD